MYATSSKSRLGLLAVIAVTLTFVLRLCLQFRGRPLDFNVSPPAASYRIDQTLLQRLLRHKCDFVAANDDGFYYGGRWNVRADRISKQTRLTGAYVEFAITNTSSVHLSLHCSDSSRLHGQQPLSKIIPQTSPFPTLEHESQPSLIVEVTAHDPVVFDKPACGLLRLTAALDPTRNHTVKATLVDNASPTGASYLDFEGVWLSKGGTLSSLDRNSVRNGSNLQPQRPYIEILNELSFTRPADATLAYPVLLSSSLGLALSQISVASHCLTRVCTETGPSIQDIYFRAGRPKHAQAWPTGQSSTSRNSGLVLTFGLHDFHQMLETEPSTQEINGFVGRFVEAYVEFITTIRLVDRSHAAMAYRSAGMDQEASYFYNSAPSTLPVFVLTPFTSSRQLRRLLGHAASTVVRRLQAAGDLSTVWIDTEGWVSQKHFQPQSNGSHSQGLKDLTLLGHAQVATHLSTHLCPYFKESCPYAKHTDFQGYLKIPAEAAMGKLLEERKVTLIKDIMNITS